MNACRAYMLLSVVLLPDSRTGYRKDIRMTSSLKSVALVGSYLPRQCGIATFTADLAGAIRENDPDLDCSIVAINDRSNGYNYPNEVCFQIGQDKLSDYRLAANFLNLRNPDAVCLQHEYGIFGGIRGSFVIEFAKNLNVPLITTLHTILKDPLPEENKITAQLCDLSYRVVVMSERGADFLRYRYHVPSEKISLVYHGIPDVPFVEPDPCKRKFSAEDKMLILTFGLLSPGKGIEYMIDALPTIVASHPNVLYLVVGATHPHCKAESGESYRLSLHDRAAKLGVSDHVVFHDRFFERDELIEIIRAADIYVTPYLNEAQIVSGTLAFAVGAGKAVVSTPYWHAQEMLANGRGRIVPFRDHYALAREINRLLAAPEERLRLRHATYEYSRPMVMAKMGQRYLTLFSEARARHAYVTALRPVVNSMGQQEQRLPLINLNHMRHMTDDTGMLQHAKYTVPNRDHGYCVDDNARALITVTAAYDLNRSDTSLLALSSTYLSFLDNAFDHSTGRFRNFMSYDRKWLENIGSQDSHGRALWALGIVAGDGANPGQVALAGRLFRDGLPALEDFSDSRSIAFPMLGIRSYLRRNESDYEIHDLLVSLGSRLRERFRRFATRTWRWHESELTYDNARLPEALMACGRIANDDDMMRTGIEVLEWLRDIQFDPIQGWFAPVGNQGWFAQSGSKAQFDQQPLEAAAMIDACIEAYECTGCEDWTQLASNCFNWYLGKNDQQVPLYDEVGGGCRDGLTASGANENQGAESTLSFLNSLLAIQGRRRMTANPPQVVEMDPKRRRLGRSGAA